MAKKLENLRENLFVQIAKLLASAAMKREFTKNDIERDPSLKATMDSIKFHADEFERELKSMCDRFPHYKRCKDYKKDK